MGLRGPPPLPAWLKADRSGRRPRPACRFAPGRPDPPAEVTDDADALAAWQDAADELEQRGDLTLADRAVLSVYALTWGRLIRAVRHVREHGERTHEGKIASELTRQLRTFSLALGLTPAGRLRLGNAAPVDEVPSFLTR
ncbi:MAG: P27 family phage terminase small subunit [Phycisphaerae bacterium]|nr:P27 family phage terminase small subunit [Phycisphaerae bacterium]NUQ44734.1 P27 family phage terminase small subunit [Phycisphaerae bacterium]